MAVLDDVALRKHAHAIQINSFSFIIENFIRKIMIVLSFSLKSLTVSTRENRFGFRVFS